MKYKGVILFIVLAAGLTLAYFMPAKQEPPGKKAIIGMQAPEFELEDIGGRIWRLADLRGKVVLLNFWATWCDTCKQEKPSIEALVEAERENKALAVVTVLYNDSARNAVSYMKRNNFDFVVLLDDKKTSADYGVTGVPETYIISRSGILMNKIIGPERWDAPEVRETLKRLADGT